MSFPGFVAPHLLSSEADSPAEILASPEVLRMLTGIRIFWTGAPIDLLEVGNGWREAPFVLGGPAPGRIRDSMRLRGNAAAKLDAGE